MRRWVGVAAALVMAGSALALFVTQSNSLASGPWWAHLPPEKR